MYYFYFSCFYYVVWITPTFTSRNVPYEKLNLRSCTCYVTVINTVIHASIFNYNPLETLIGEYTCNLWVCKWHNVPVTWGMSMFACCKSYMWEKGRTKEDGKRKMSRNGWQGNTSGKGGEVKKKEGGKGREGDLLTAHGWEENYCTAPASPPSSSTSCTPTIPIYIHAQSHRISPVSEALNVRGITAEDHLQRQIIFYKCQWGSSSLVAKRWFEAVWACWFVSNLWLMLIILSTMPSFFQYSYEWEQWKHWELHHLVEKKKKQALAPGSFRIYSIRVDCQLHKLDCWRNLATDLLFPAHKPLTHIHRRPPELLSNLWPDSI